MKEEEILKRLSLPKSTWTLKTFPFNKLDKEMTLAQRKLMYEIIEPRGIRVLATINQQNSNIIKYEDESVRFEEIIIFLIKVKSFTKNKNVYNTLAKKIPYPLIIIFQKDQNYKVAISEHEKGDEFLLRPISMFITEEDIEIENLLESMDFRNQQKNNLQKYFQDTMDGLVQIQAKSRYEVESTEINIKILEHLEDLDKEIEQLIKEAKKEKQMNKRIALQIQATKLKEEKNLILSRGKHNEKSTE